MSLPNRPRGTQDIYPSRSLVYERIREIVVEVLKKNNYQPVILPTFEYLELFTNSLGSTTDIVHKEMFIFADRKGRKLALRPEGTASVARLVCQNKLVKEGYPLKFYYWANMFRYERPQKGRHREFWQLGIELINAQGVLADYQILKLVSDIFQSLGIKNFIFNLNYLGENDTKERYKNQLRAFITQNSLQLCENCQRRYMDNPLRIIDCSLCKEKHSYPEYRIVWDKKNDEYFKELKKLLDNFNLPYNYDSRLVRGIDYYTGLVFEVDLGENKSILGGGRYDALYQEVANIGFPAIGFAVGVERLVEYLENSKDKLRLLKLDNKIDIFFFASVSEAYLDIIKFKEKLKSYPLVIDYNIEIRKMKSFLKIIDYYQPHLLIILGKKELESEKIIIKDCTKKKDFFVKKNELTNWVISYLENNNLSK